MKLLYKNIRPLIGGIVIGIGASGLWCASQQSAFAQDEGGNPLLKSLDSDMVIAATDFNPDQAKLKATLKLHTITEGATVDRDYAIALLWASNDLRMRGFTQRDATTAILILQNRRMIDLMERQTKLLERMAPPAKNPLAKD